MCSRLPTDGAVPSRGPAAATAIVGSGCAYVGSEQEPCRSNPGLEGGRHGIQPDTTVRRPRSRDRCLSLAPPSHEAFSMCGIAGVYWRERASPRPHPAIDRMVRAIHHRGPDSDGRSSTTFADVGFKRLSIIDL